MKTRLVISQAAQAKISKQVGIEEFPQVADFYAGQGNDISDVCIVMVEGVLYPSDMKAYSCFFDGNEKGTIDVSISDNTVVPIEAPNGSCIMVSSPLCREDYMAETCIVHEMAHYIDKGKQTNPASATYHESHSEIFARKQEKDFLVHVGLDENQIQKFFRTKYAED